VLREAMAPGAYVLLKPNSRHADIMADRQAIPGSTIVGRTCRATFLMFRGG
jgi:hypothetical protein